MKNKKNKRKPGRPKTIGKNKEKISARLCPDKIEKLIEEFGTITKAIVKITDDHLGQKKDKL